MQFIVFLLLLFPLCNCNPGIISSLNRGSLSTPLSYLSISISLSGYLSIYVSWTSLCFSEQETQVTAAACQTSASRRLRRRRRSMATGRGRRCTRWRWWTGASAHRQTWSCRVVNSHLAVVPDVLSLDSDGKLCTLNGGRPIGMGPDHAVKFSYAWRSQFSFEPVSSTIACS